MSGINDAHSNTRTHHGITLWRVRMLNLEHKHSHFLNDKYRPFYDLFKSEEVLARVNPTLHSLGLTDGSSPHSWEELCTCFSVLDLLRVAHTLRDASASTSEVLRRAERSRRQLLELRVGAQPSPCWAGAPTRRWPPEDQGRWRDARAVSQAGKNKKKTKCFCEVKSWALQGF